MKKSFKTLSLILLVYILFCCSQWVVVRIYSEKQLKDICRKIEKNMPKNELVNLVLSYQDFKIYQSDRDHLMFFPKEALPETPSCHVYLNNDKIEKVTLFDARNQED